MRLQNGEAHLRSPQPQGAPECLAWTADNLDITPPLLARQAQHLAARLGVPLERAKLIAGLAFDQGGRS